MLNCWPDNFVLHPIEKVTSNSGYSYHFNADVNFSKVELIRLQPLLAAFNFWNQLNYFSVFIYYFI